MVGGSERAYIQLYTYSFVRLLSVGRQSDSVTVTVTRMRSISSVTYMMLMTSMTHSLRLELSALSEAVTCAFV